MKHFPLHNTGFAALLVLTFAAPSHASLLVENSPLLGASTVIFDTTTDLYWLKPDLTLGQSYAIVQAEEGTGIYTGFSYADYAQVDQLFTDAGITNLSNSEVAVDYTADLNLTNLFGATVTATGTVNGLNYTETGLMGNILNNTGVLPQDPLQAFTLAFTFNAVDPRCGSADCGETSAGNFFGSTTTPSNTGNWLVAPSLASTPVSGAPEPGTFALLGGALVCLGLLGWKSRAKGN